MTDTIVQLVQSVAFPIAMCVLMAFYIKNKDDKQSESISKLSDAINNNTVVMQSLIAKIDGLK